LVGNARKAHSVRLQAKCIIDENFFVAVASVVVAYGQWLVQSDDIPKLFNAANPGAIVVCRRWPYQRETEVEGIHFVQEDAPPKSVRLSLKGGVVEEGTRRWARWTAGAKPAS
jgi:hypothetical protein